MASIKFQVRSKGEAQPIYIRFINGRQLDVKCKTGLHVNSVYFDNKSGAVRNIAKFKEKDQLQKKLRDLKSHIHDALATVSNPSKEWLTREIRKFNGEEITIDGNILSLENAFDQYIDYISAVKSTTEGTIRTYKVSKNRILSFQKHMNREYLISDVGGSFKRDIANWAYKNVEYSVSTHAKTMRQLRTVLKHAAMTHNIQIDNSIFKVDESTKKKKEDIIPEPTLTVEELEKIESLSLPKHLNDARDWLIIGCWTALRVSDLMNLSVSNIVNIPIGNNGKTVKAISDVQQKTSDRVLIPIHPMVEAIIEKHNGFPQPIYDQKYNNQIKEVCKLAGIDEIIKGSKPKARNGGLKKVGMFPKWQLVSSHIGRRSFATNNYQKLANQDIMRITGHRTEKEFLNYVKQMPDDHVGKFLDAWR